MKPEDILSLTQTLTPHESHLLVTLTDGRSYKGCYQKTEFGILILQPKVIRSQYLFAFEQIKAITVL
ncbi:hypothetical protein ACFYKX_11420 [Cytobacillus sp. FJAT-54145]|uniref:Uncharacterized protein n=1 Tax=Cytobacillus spartinae TaxID=3299023 RepID=A0ABW6KE84_9BACI